MNWYMQVLQKYADFSGRARRTEYWMFTLFNVLIYIVLAIVENVIGLTIQGSGMGILSLLYSLGVLVPGIAVAVRRLHDTSKSAWWILVGLVPLVGGIVLLIFLVMDSTPGSNQFGPNPKGAMA